ncbi:MerR family transcriptional regulator [Alkalicoccus daliensis]|uniref:Transcriptional regulator, MerR family n=1 Tax=Alkalicoccus daliensis TaxID=745820 RepID=A0A1H0D4H3_9BACI|nr:MerR family transcriptional regulator [Alkalicoccus daliensis]SDN65077.1 transcriptional regulator, MerR family [Alkalicoccus daliensis]
MKLKVKEVAELVGISVRTLHYYDQVQLLSPAKTSSSGYRLYAEADLEKLQQILFFKELGFSLKEIKKIITSPSYDVEEALLLQRKMLVEKRKSVEKMIENLDKTMKHKKGEIYMTKEERFEGINFRDNPYEQEARERWGDTPVDEANANLGNKSQEEQDHLAEKWEMYFRKFAELRGKSPDAAEVQEVMREWYDFLNENFTRYSLEAFSGLGQLYVSDERFTKNIDQYGEGLAQFMSEAMQRFAEKKK